MPPAANTREPARTASAAIERYRKFLQASLSCITKTTWLVAPGRSNPNILVLATAEDPVRLRRDPGLATQFLTASQNFRVDAHPDRSKEMKVFTEAYSYQLYSTDDMSKASELLLWHWHPGEGHSEPHIHVGVGYAQSRALPKRHVPSGRVSFESVIRFAIADLRVRPARDDWDGVLADSEHRFDEYKTWGMRPPKSSQ